MDKLYIQTYSVRSAEETDFEGTLRRLKAIGYTGVEFAGEQQKLPVQELKALLDDIGLDVISAHITPDAVESQIDTMAALGARFVVDPMSQFETYEQALALAETLNRAGEVCRKAGLKYGYHNHTTEFGTANGKYLLEHLLENTDPALVMFELDAGWCTTAGADPLAMLAKYAGRFQLIHAKEAGKVVGVNMPVDFSKIEWDAEGRPVLTAEMLRALDEWMKMNVPTGKGLIDWAQLKAAADAAGAQAYIVEREYDYLGDILACVGEDYAYLKQI